MSAIRLFFAGLLVLIATLALIGFPAQRQPATPLASAPRGSEPLRPVVPEPPAVALARQMPKDPSDRIEDLPDGPGREDVFYACTACHGLALTKQQAMSRERWDELMDWMVSRHNMNPLPAELRPVIVDYLAQHFPPRQQRGRTNPFANR